MLQPCTAVENTSRQPNKRHARKVHPDCKTRDSVVECGGKRQRDAALECLNAFQDFSVFFMRPKAVSTMQGFAPCISATALHDAAALPGGQCSIRPNLMSLRLIHLHGVHEIGDEVADLIGLEG